MKSARPASFSAKTLNVKGKLVDLSSPVVMGILNVTPDSFFASSRLATETEILKQAEKMLLEGAAFLDVGGYSSRPGAADIPVEEELERIVKGIRVIVKEFPSAILSIDTFRAEVARQGVLEGAGIINDISAGELDHAMFDTIAELKVPYIAMHMRGTPQTMKELTQYSNIVKEMVDYFLDKINRLKVLGVHDVIIDPGFGFAKTNDQNFEVLAHLYHLRHLDKPILAGLSRKSMIWKTLDITADEALNGTTALNMTALMKGANILRVHDVKEAVQAVKLASNVYPTTDNIRF